MRRFGGREVPPRQLFQIGLVDRQRVEDGRPRQNPDGRQPDDVPGMTFSTSAVSLVTFREHAGRFARGGSPVDGEEAVKTPLPMSRWSASLALT